MKNREISRRIFLMGTLATAAGCATTPRRVVRRRVSPNEKLNIAGIGAGGRGASDIEGCNTENIVALCDVDDNSAAKMFERYPKAARYRDFRRMLEKEKSIDAVTIGTPDHIHAFAAMAAMELGKHVYVEKPLTHSIYEARMLMQAARKYKVATQMGNQGHSGDGVRQLCEFIWSGAIGQVREVHVWTDRPIWPQGIPRPKEVMPVPPTLDWDLWIGPAPFRPYNKCYCPFNWRGWWDFGCGALGDMGCHNMDPANWALKLCPPTSVEVVEQKGNNDETGPVMSTIRYEFPQRGDMAPVTLYWYDGKGNLPKRPEGIPADEVLGDGSNGSLFIGDKGIATSGTYGGKTRLLPASRMKDFQMPPQILPRIKEEDHHQDWIQACKGGTPACSNFDYSVPLTEIVLLGNVALRAGQKIEWDSANMKVTNVPEANRFIRRKYRRGWRL